VKTKIVTRLARAHLVLAMATIVTSCDESGKERPSEGSQARFQGAAAPAVQDRASLRSPLRDSARHLSKNDIINEFLTQMAGRWRDDDAMALIEARMADFATDEERNHFVNLLVRQIPHEAYELRWDLLAKHIENPSVRTGLLGMVLSDSIPVAPDWVVKQIQDSSDPELCRRGVNGITNYLSDAIDAIEIPDWLANAFEDKELYSQGLDFWLSDIGKAKSDPRFKEVYENILRDRSVSSSLRAKIADLYAVMPSDDTPAEQAALLLELGIKDGGWRNVIDSGSKLSGGDLNQVLDSVYEASPYVRADFINAYISHRSISQVITDLPTLREAARSDIIIQAAAQIFDSNLSADIASVIRGFPAAEQNRIADELVAMAALKKVPLAEIEPLLNLGADRVRKMEIYQNPKNLNSQ
jgi:hypothetical protein